jgi:polysaccharide biosynthesis transport protein
MENKLITKKPIDYLKIFFRRKWFIIIPTVIGIVGGVIAANSLPKVYESSTLILVEEGKASNPLMEGLTVSTSTSQRLATLREQILGWDRILQLIRTLNLDKDVKNQIQFEGLVRKLRSNIIVRLRANNVVGIYYESNEPLEAKNIVQTITDIFIAENLRQQNKESEDAINFINDQLALYQRKLKQSEISSMEDQLDKLLIDSTEKHPLVIDLNKKIEAAKEDLEKGNYKLEASTVAGSDEELRKMREDLKKMREELATASLDAKDGGANRAKLAGSTNEKLYKLLLLDKMDQVATRDLGVNEKLYNVLLERLETAKLTQRLESSKEGTRYTILDPARLPLTPAKPNKVMVLLMGAFMGACAGLGLIFLTEMFDHSFLGVDEAREFLGLPILGAIPKIITHDDLRVQKIRRAGIASASILIGVLLAVVIIFNVILGS